MPSESFSVCLGLKEKIIITLDWFYNFIDQHLRRNNQVVELREREPRSCHTDLKCFTSKQGFITVCFHRDIKQLSHKPQNLAKYVTFICV